MILAGTGDLTSEQFNWLMGLLIFGGIAAYIVWHWPNRPWRKK